MLNKIYQYLRRLFDPAYPFNDPYEVKGISKHVEFKKLSKWEDEVKEILNAYGLEVTDKNIERVAKHSLKHVILKPRTAVQSTFHTKLKNRLKKQRWDDKLKIIKGTKI